MTPKEMADKRAKLVADARKILDAAKSEKRDMTGEENTQYETIFKDVDELRTKIDAAAVSERRDARMAEETRWLSESAGRRSDPTDPARHGAGGGGGGSEVRELAWGEQWTSPRKLILAGPRAADEYRSAYGKWLAYGLGGLGGDETRALSADVPQSGGYMLTPLQMWGNLIKFVDNAVIMRQKGTVLPSIPAGTSLGVPSLDTDIDDADWTAELATGNEDSSMAFGRRELKPHPLAKRIKVSNTLLQATGMAEQVVTSRLAYKHAVASEKGYMTGTGAAQPLGIFTASPAGISTGRDVSTGNTTTSIGADGLIEAKYAVKPQYQAVGEWVFHRDGLKQVRKLKDGDGRYIWQTGLAGAADTLLDRPVNQSEYAPNTYTTGLYAGIFGDLKQYWIVDSLDYAVQRLIELYAATNQTGFIGRMQSDGMPVLEEAFARIKLA